MNYDELAYVNQQLAAMLRDGIPLEGSLRQLCATMQRGKLRTELTALEADLAQGTPLHKAIAKRELPELYVHVLQAGARSNDMPGLLTLLADYFQSANSISTRLKGLMVYPTIVLVLSLAFSMVAATVGRQMVWALSDDSRYVNPASSHKPSDIVSGQSRPVKKHLRNWPFDYLFTFNPNTLWIPPVILASLVVLTVTASSVPAFRRELRWRVPAFREACLARLATTMAMLLKAGCNLTEAIALTEHIEAGTSAGKDLGRWKDRCAAGHAKFSEIASGSKIIPPMFIWLVSGAGEDLATGFERAARTYRTRADYHANVLLYAALPVSLLVLGFVILMQIYPIGHLLFDTTRMFRI